LPRTPWHKPEVNPVELTLAMAVNQAAVVRIAGFFSMEKSAPGFAGEFSFRQFQLFLCLLWYIRPWYINIYKSLPICSMYGIFTYIWAIFKANVGKYSSTMEHMGYKSIFMDIIFIPLHAEIVRNPICSHLLPIPSAVHPGFF
jgi:hypothetical protein